MIVYVLSAVAVVAAHLLLLRKTKNKHLGEIRMMQEHINKFRANADEYLTVAHKHVMETETLKSRLAKTTEELAKVQKILDTPRHKSVENLKQNIHKLADLFTYSPIATRSDCPKCNVIDAETKYNVELEAFYKKNDPAGYMRKIRKATHSLEPNAKNFPSFKQWCLNNQILPCVECLEWASQRYNDHFNELEKQRSNNNNDANNKQALVEMVEEKLKENALANEDDFLTQEKAKAFLTDLQSKTKKKVDPPLNSAQWDEIHDKEYAEKEGLTYDEEALERPNLEKFQQLREKLAALRKLNEEDA